MSLGSRIRDLRKEKKMSQEELGKYLNVSKVSVSGYENDTREPSKDAIVKLAQLFGVSTDYLLGNTNKKHYYELTEKDKKDAAEQVEDVINGMTADINFYGEPMDDEGRAKLKASLQMALELAKQEAKKKFTPKKYRDGE